MQEATRRRRRCLLHLGALVCQEDLLLADLQQLVGGLLQEKTALIRDSLSADHFLLRELRADLLPGRSYWTCAAPAVTADLHSIGRSGASSFGKGGAALQGSLKRLGLSKDGAKDRHLVVESLRDVQAKVRPPAGAFRVWAQQLLNPGAEEGCAIMSPAWPPRQVLVNGGVAPSLMHLKRPVVQEFPELSLERVAVFKYYPSSLLWTELLSGGDGQKRKGKKDSLCGPPYHLQEGDQVCAFEALGRTGGAEHRSISVALPEDLCLRAAKEAAKRERSEGKRNSSSKGSKGEKAKFRAEVTLSLGSGFDFSDEEEGEGEQGTASVCA